MVASAPTFGARHRLESPVAVAAAVLAAYGVWTAWTLAEDRVLHIATVGEKFQRQGSDSAAIERLADDTVHPIGYDGQFFLFIALDPAEAHRYMDEPAYRYGRIGYPIVGRALALGQERLVPYALLFLNLAAVGAGTFALAVLLRRRGLSPWWAALYGLYPGLFIGVSFDLSEPLAYALVACAVAAYGDAPTTRPLVAATVLLALAVLTREGTAVFAVSFAAGIALAWPDAGGRRRVRAALAVLAGAILPYLAWKGFLATWLDDAGLPESARLAAYPFQGLRGQGPLDRPSFEQLYAVAVPALLAAMVAAVTVRRATAGLVALLVNVVLFVALLPPGSWDGYEASGRIALGVVVAFLLCLPTIVATGRGGWAWAVAVLWLAPWYALLPRAFGL